MLRYISSSFFYNCKHPANSAIDPLTLPWISIIIREKISPHFHQDRNSRLLHMDFAAARASMKMFRRRGYKLAAVLLFEFVVFCSSSMDSSAPTTAILIRVDQSGNGDYTKIQDAIDAVPSNNSQLYFILVKPGTYRSFDIYKKKSGNVF